MEEFSGKHVQVEVATERLGLQVDKRADQLGLQIAAVRAGKHELL